MYMKKPFQGGGNRFGGNGGGFGGGRGGNGGFQKREMTMHKATCSACGKTCEVPFRPTGEKPVYCKECFAERGGGSDRNDRSDRPSFDRAPRKSFDNRFEPRAEAPRAERAPEGNNDIKKQFEYVNSRLDKLTNMVDRLLSASVSTAPVQKAVVVKSPELKALVTKATKVATPKVVAPKAAAPKVLAKKAKKKGPNKR